MPTKKIVNLETNVKNFKNFLYLAWKHLQLPEPTPIQYDIADYLQKPQKTYCYTSFQRCRKVLDYFGICMPPNYYSTHKGTSLWSQRPKTGQMISVPLLKG